MRLQFENIKTALFSFPSTNPLVFWGSIFLSGIVGIVVCVLIWLSRGDWVYPSQTNRSLLAQPISGDMYIGQTMVADNAGLQGIGVKLCPDGMVLDERLILRLYTDVDRQTLLRSSVSSPANIDKNRGGYFDFQFDPIQNSRHQYYYWTIEADGQPGHPVTFCMGPLNSYLNGSAYINGVPQEFQMAFHLNYDRSSMLQDFLWLVIFSFPVTFAVLLFLFVPGAILYVWLFPKNDLDVLEKLAVITGLSLVVYPLVIMFQKFTPVLLNRGVVVGIFIVLIIILFISFYLKRSISIATVKVSMVGQIKQPAFWAFWIVFIVSLVVRLWVIRGVDIPLWADSYHHTMLAQLIVDNGRLPTNWEPYAPMQSVNYHYGFHSMVAFFHWLTDLPVIQSVLVFAQILNAITVLMAYLLGKKLAGNTWAGVIAALITGLISKYPMFYVNWGRYTQLAGQIILPVLIILSVLLLDKKGQIWQLLVLGAISISSLILTHYRVFVFYPCFMLPFVLIRWYQAGWNRSIILRDIFRLMLLGGVALLLTSPRLIGVLNSRLLWNFDVTGAKVDMNDTYTRRVEVVPSLFDFLPPLVVILGLVGLSTGSWHKREGIFSLGVCWCMLLLAVNPHFLNLPGSNLITNFTIFIGAYIIFSVLAGYPLGLMIESITCKWKNAGWIILCFMLVMAFQTGWNQLKIPEPAGMLVTQPDLRAMDWIKKHTSPSATFLINSRSAYVDGVVVGTDGGWWIPFLTGRRNTVPPMVYEMETFLGGQEVQEIYTTFFSLPLSDKEFALQMKNYDVDYIYIGQQRGAVWQEGYPQLDVKMFETSRHFQLVYAYGGVRIYKPINNLRL